MIRPPREGDRVRVSWEGTLKTWPADGDGDGWQVEHDSRPGMVFVVPTYASVEVLAPPMPPVMSIVRRYWPDSDDLMDFWQRVDDRYDPDADPEDDEVWQQAGGETRWSWNEIIATDGVVEIIWTPPTTAATEGS